MTTETITATLTRRSGRSLTQNKQRRNTAQKQLVLDLATSDPNGHLTADEVYELAREQDPHISRGTVYRNLNALAEAGVIRRLSMPLGPDRFDCRRDDHYHFLCRRCLRVDDSQLPYNRELNSVAPGLPGCRVEWHRLVLVGLCAGCAGQAEEEQASCEDERR